MAPIQGQTHQAMTHKYGPIYIVLKEGIFILLDWILVKMIHLPDSLA